MGATKKDRRINAVLSVLLTILCIAWMYPVFMILMNSLKTERAITTTHAFELPNAETFDKTWRQDHSSLRIQIS